MEPQTLRFESFELDLRLRELRTGEKRVRLQEQPFEILRLMLERPGDVVTRDELRRRLWPEGTFVDFEHSLNAAVKRLRAVLGDDADNPRFVETLPRRGYRFIARLDLAEPPAGQAAAAPAYARLAVLPFQNLSADEGQEYFSDGLTEEMIAQLGRMLRSRVAVIARWSAMVFKGTSQRACAVGEALGARYLLEGSVRRDGDRVRITARLVDAAAETHLWSDTYERDLTDYLSVQTEVATRIAESLALELVPDRAPAARPAVDGAAYQEYLKGLYYWNKPADDGVEPAVMFLERAVRLAPSFGAAHAALARAWVARAESYQQLPRSALVQADAIAARALELDPDLSEAHVARGDVRRMLDCDWREAEAAYRRSIALNPSQVGAYRGSAMILSLRGRHAEATRESQRACELDPFCLTAGTVDAWVRYAAGDLTAAIDRCRHTIDLDPEFIPARRLLGASYLQLEETAEAIAELESAAMLADTDPVLLCWLAHALATAGRRRDAETVIGRVQSLGRERHVPAYHLALAYAGLGDADAAFAALDQAWVDRDPARAAIGVEPRFDRLREDPRYARLRQELALPVLEPLEPERRRVMPAPPDPGPPG